MPKANEQPELDPVSTASEAPAVDQVNSSAAVILPDGQVPIAKDKLSDLMFAATQASIYRTMFQNVSDELVSLRTSMELQRQMNDAAGKKA